MDIYVNGYDCVETGCPACGPNDGLFRTLKYILVDESQVSVSGFPFDTNNGGPWDPTLCGFLNQEPNVYSLGTANFFYVTVTGGQQKLGTITLTGIAQDAFKLVVANDLTALEYPAYSDGYISNCNLGQEYPADALLTINSECDIDADCSDALFCNGAETCVHGVCQNGVPVSCPDDGTFCNGTEGCSEQADACVSSGDPCGAGTVCNEATNTCEEFVTARIRRLVPPYEFQSRWFPILKQLYIIGSDTNFEAGVSKVAFEPVKAVWGFRPQVADEENIRIWVYILPKWFSRPLDEPVKVIVTTGSEVVSSDWEIALLPFPLDKEGEELQ
jgi:hypothetical protein